MNLKFKHILYSALISATVGGIVLGIGGRLLMRGIARMAGSTGGFSWGGSLEVIALGALIGLFSGIAYGLLLNVFQRSLVLWGLVFGALCYLAIIVLPIDGKGAINGFPQIRTKVIGLFGGLFLIYGLITAIAVKVMLSRKTRI